MIGSSMTTQSTARCSYWRNIEALFLKGDVFDKTVLVLYAIFNSFVCWTDGQLLLFNAVTFNSHSLFSSSGTNSKISKVGINRPHACQKILDSKALSFVLRALTKFKVCIISLVRSAINIRALKSPGS